MDATHDTQASVIQQLNSKAQMVSEIITDDHCDKMNSSDNKPIASRHPHLKTRVSPRILVNALKCLNEPQKKAITKIGFGKLLFLKITQLPQKLTYNVLDNFDPRSCEGNGKAIHIEPEDVHITLGLPIGRRGDGIERSRNYEPSSLHCAAFFKQKRDRIRPKDVAAQMLAQTDGGIWFLRHFLILVTSCLIETTKNGYVIPHMMKYLSGVESVSKLNWCEYVVNRLVDCKIAWERNKQNEFSGPILFLTMVYVDRVILYRCSIPRLFPTIKGWTESGLKQRQLNEQKAEIFGVGYLDKKLKKKNIQQRRASQHTEGKNKNGIAATSGDLQIFAADVVEKAKLLPYEISELKITLKRSPEQGENKINLEVSMNKGSPPKPLSSSTLVDVENDDDEFWSDPNSLAMIERAEKSARTNIMLNDIASEMPSFSLGLTQEEELLDYTTTERCVSPTLTLYNAPTMTEPAGKVTSRGVKEPDAVGFTNSFSAMMGSGAKNDKHVSKLKNFCSPFCKRVVPATEKLSEMEKKLYFWVLRNNNPNKEIILFSNGRANLRRREMMTLARTLYVSASILDVWSQILNHNEKYGSSDSPNRFFATTYPCKQWFVEFLERCGLISEAVGLKRAPITRLKMFWRDNENKCDCAIYAMRHMETYLGEGVSGWNPGLKKNSANQMSYLRAKYCTSIITCESNMHQQQNVAEANTHYRQACMNGPIDVIELLLNGN